MSQFSLLKLAPLPTSIRLGGLLAFLLLPMLALAQPVPIPALRAAVAQARSDTSRSRLLSELGNAYEDENLDSCLYFLNQSLRMAQRGQDAFGTARAMYQLGRANMYYTKNDAKASYWFNRALTIAKASTDHLHLAQCFMGLMVISAHQRIGNMEDLYDKALLHAKKARNRIVLANIYDARMDIDQFLGRHNDRYHEQLIRLSMAASKDEDPDHWLTVSIEYCDFLRKQGRTAQSVALARQLAAQTGRLRKTYGEFVYRADMARLLLSLEQYDRAESALKGGIAFEGHRAKPDTTHLLHYYRFLANTYTQQGDWQNAYQTRDSLARIELWLQRKRQTRDAKLAMTELKGALTIEKKEAEIALLSAQQQQQRLYLIGALLIAALFLTFAVIFRHNRQRIQWQKDELSQLNTSLTQLNATKDKLFALLAHDLRSPVSGLKNTLMLLNWGALDQHEFTVAASDLGQELTTVQTMLENTLDWSLSQMRGFKAYPESVAFSPILEQEIHLLNAMAKASHIRVSNQIRPDSLLVADKNHLAVIFRNLLQNALKFTPTGGQVDFHSCHKNGIQQITVTDTGVGMDKAQLSTLFRLHQSPTRTNTASKVGSGLGLVLVHDLVTANGGQIDVESELGKGTTFTLTFARTTRAVQLADPLQPNARVSVILT